MAFASKVLPGSSTVGAPGNSRSECQRMPEVARRCCSSLNLSRFLVAMTMCSINFASRNLYQR